MWMKRIVHNNTKVTNTLGKLSENLVRCRHFTDFCIPAVSMGGVSNRYLRSRDRGVAGALKGGFLHDPPH